MNVALYHNLVEKDIVGIRIFILLRRNNTQIDSRKQILIITIDNSNKL